MAYSFSHAHPRHPAAARGLAHSGPRARAALGALAVQHRADRRAGALRRVRAGPARAGCGYIRPGLAAAIVVVLAIVLVVAPLASVIGLVAAEAQDMATGVIRSPLLARIRGIRVGPYQVGAQLEALGAQPRELDRQRARSGLIGTATRLGIQLTITFFGLYYLLVAPRGELARPCGPSSRSPPRAPRFCGTGSATSRSRPWSGPGSRRWCRASLVGLGVLGLRA